MFEPSELSLSEIHTYFVLNSYKVTNTQLVKYFRKYLTGNGAEEARKQFKNYVNILATIKTENNEKFLILRRKFYDEVPSEEMMTSYNNMGSTSSASLMSLPTDISDSPIRQSADMRRMAPPMYRAPPQLDNFSYFPPPAMSPQQTMPPQMPMSTHSLQQHIPPSMTTIGLPILEPQTKEQYKDCVSEFQNVMTNFMESRGGNGMEKVDVTSRKNSFEQIIEEQASQSPSLPPRKNRIDHRSISRENSMEQQQQFYDSNRDENKENNQNVMTSPMTAAAAAETEENKLSVKEAMAKFNRFASEEEAEKLIPSPISKAVKSKTEKHDDQNDSTENLSSHPKSREWLISASRANYQELAKLGHEYPQLVRLQDPNTNALHWASKHGNENVVKLIAGTFRCDVNCQTNGGYTSLHIAMQFGRNDIFELLCNVYKANRDIMDWSGKKPLDYQKQMTNMSASFTFNKIKSRKKIPADKDSSFLRIGSLRHFLGGSNSVKGQQGNYVRSSLQHSSLDIDKGVHKGYGSASSLPQLSEEMGPPKNMVKKRKQKRDHSESHSMPTTPNLENRSQMNSDPGGSDSDTAYGFTDSWGN